MGVWPLDDSRYPWQAVRGVACRIALDQHPSSGYSARGDSKSFDRQGFVRLEGTLVKQRNGHDEPRHNCSSSRLDQATIHLFGTRWR